MVDELAQDDSARLQAMAMSRMLLTKAVVAFHPVITEITKDVKATLFLCQLMYWSDKGQDQRGWIYKTREEWHAETSMGRREQEGARSKLRKLNLIEEAQHGTNRVIYYRVRWEVLHEALAVISDRHQSAQWKGQQDVPLEEAEGAHSIKETETTTKTTTDIYIDDEFPWLGILRTIPGWGERGEPLVTPLIAWAKDKGYAPEYLYDHAIGVSQQAGKGLKNTASLARKFQNACNAGYYARRNGGRPAATTDDQQLERIRKAKNA